MKNLWRRRGVPSKSGGYILQYASQNPRNESSDNTSSDSDDSGSSYKTSQLSPRIYNLKLNKNQKHNHFPKNYDLSSSPVEKDNNFIGIRANHTDEEDDPRNICAGINVPELVKYFDGLEICNGQILTGRTIKGKPWEASGKKNSNGNVILPHTNDHTYSKPPKTENSGKPIVNSYPTKDDFFDERFRNVCTTRRKRIMKDELKNCSLIRDHHGTVGKETPVVTRLDNSDNISTKTNVPMKKYTSIVGPMPHPPFNIAPNGHFTRNNDCRKNFKQCVSNSNKFESISKSSNIMPPTIAVTRDTYFYPRDRGDQNTMEYQQKDYRMRNTCLDNQTKYQKEKNCQITEQSAGLHTRPSFHMGHKDCKNNLLTRPHTLSQNDYLLRNAGPVEDNRQGKKDQDQNLTFDISPEDCASMCLSRKDREYQCQETEAETSTKISASKLSISQSPSHPSVLSIRIDINLSHPNLYSAGARSLYLKDRNKRKTEKP